LTGKNKCFHNLGSFLYIYTVFADCLVGLYVFTLFFLN